MTTPAGNTAPRVFFAVPRGGTSTNPFATVCAPSLSETCNPDTGWAPELATVATTSYPRGPNEADGRTTVAITAAFGSSFPRAASTRTTFGRIACAPGGAVAGGGTSGGGASSRIECAARSLKAMMRLPATGLSPSALAAAARQPVMSDIR